MARRTRTVWGKWDCGNCSTRGISAEPPAGEAQPRCPTCGSPREQHHGEAAYLDNARSSTGRVIAANVADTEEELALAGAGRDWTCAACDGDNRAGRATCVGCGAPRGSSGARAAAVANPGAGAQSSGWLARFPGGAPAVLLGGCVLAVTAGWLGWGEYTSGYRRDAPGAVTELAWSHTINVQTFTPLVAGGWQAELMEAPARMPVGGSGESPGVANIRDCAERHHHDEEYACGSDRVCEQRSRTVSDGEDCSEVCHTVDNQNGSFTETCDDVCTPRTHTESYEECRDVTRYCTRAISQTWCTYDTWEWTTMDTAQASGAAPTGSGALPWPSADAGDLQRLVRLESYTVGYTVPVDGRVLTRTESLADEASFLSWHLGDPVIATLGWDDELVSIARPGAVAAP